MSKFLRMVTIIFQPLLQPCWLGIWSWLQNPVGTIVLASHLCTCVLLRHLCYLHTLKLPQFFHFHGDFHQKWHFAHPEVSLAHPELPFLAKSMVGTVPGNLKKMLYSCTKTSKQVGAGLIFAGHVRMNQWSDFFGRGPIFSGHRSWNIRWWFWKLRWAHNTCFSLFLMSYSL